MRASSRESRVALIGFGLAGEFLHAPLIAATAGLRLDTIVTSSAERGKRAVLDYPAARILSSVDALWDSTPRPDLIVIATPNRTHVLIAERAIGHGCAVVVDKPLAVRATDAWRLIELAERRGTMLTVYHNRRWDGDFLTVRRLVSAGRLGTVWRFESRFERWRPTPKPGWRQDADPEAAGGVLYDLGSHLIDQALLLFGAVDRVYAELDTRVGAPGVDDDAFVALTHASGVRSHLWMSTTAAQAGPRFRLLGSRAAFTKYRLDIQEAALRSGKRPDMPGWGEEPSEMWGVLGATEDVERIPTERGAYPSFYRKVAEALLTGSAAPVDAADAARVIEVIEAARRSAAAAELVDVTPQGKMPSS